MTKELLHIYIGFDTRNYGQTLAYEGCKRSIEAKLNRDKYEVEIHQLNLKELMKSGHMYRDVDPLASTEFTYTRFLVPFLNGYKGKALFCDSDFIWDCCISEAFDYLQNDQAVACVQHDYTPNATVKMNGLAQCAYPRKNWSSLMVFNCEHPSTKLLTVQTTNEQSPAWLHRMEWAKDTEIGMIPYQYNYLVDTYNTDDAKVYHYTDGGPWHPGYENVNYGNHWKQYMTDTEIIKLKEELAVFYRDHPDYSKTELLV
jgi:lipopolysaccharide biosynthesis glycosyltransferase